MVGSNKAIPRTNAAESKGPTESGHYVTHADLLQIAKKNHCAGIHTEPVVQLCRPVENFWVFKATVYKSARCRGFVGYGDAHPGNVSPLIFNHAELRMAETRAVNRALRKAYGIALCSVEELPPWALSAEQLLSLNRTFQSGKSLQKGIHHANENSRSQSTQRKKISARRSVSRSGGSV
jgi:hypothetical protein